MALDVLERAGRRTYRQYVPTRILSVDVPEININDVIW
jgi:hypothetical protein